MLSFFMTEYYSSFIAPFLDELWGFISYHTAMNVRVQISLLVFSKISIPLDKSAAAELLMEHIK